MLERLNQAGQSLPFPVACDPKREAVKAFGVHDPDHDIALPSTIILDKQGRIAWQHIADNVFDRPEDRVILARLAEVAQ